MESRRIKRILIAPEVLMSLVTNGVKHFEVIDGLPKTTTYLGTNFETQTGLVVLYVTDESFEGIAIGSEIPVFKPICEGRDGHNT